MSIESGVKIVVKTKITPKFEDRKFVSLNTRKKKSFHATAKIYGEISRGISKDSLKNPLNFTLVLYSRNPKIVPKNVENKATDNAKKQLFPKRNKVSLFINNKLLLNEPSGKNANPIV